MLKAAVLRRYQKFWIKRSTLRKSKNKSSDEELFCNEEFSTLRLLCVGLLSETERNYMDQIDMDVLIERIIDSDEVATYNRLMIALLDKNSGFVVNCYLSDGSTPLHLVAKEGFSDCVRALIQHDADVNAIHAQLGYTALQLAAMIGSYKTMNYLLNAGANRSFVNTLHNKQRSTIHYLAEYGCSIGLLMLLNPTQGNIIKRNEEKKEINLLINLQDLYGNTALHLACIENSEECVKILIEVRFAKF